MAIPKLNNAGYLPPGVHETTLDDIKSAFGSFQRSDRRVQLFEKLAAYCQEARECGLVVSVVIDGSFVTSKEDPNDIDLVAELSFAHDFAADLPPSAYNVLSGRRVRRRFGFDLFLARVDSPEAALWIDFFHQVRLAPNLRKGILRARL